VVLRLASRETPDQETTGRMEKDGKVMYFKNCGTVGTGPSLVRGGAI